MASKNTTMGEDAPYTTDSTAWMTTGTLADFFLMYSAEIKYLCMFGYTFLHGCKLFPTLKDDQPMSYKFVRMIFQCVGGGILVPIFINSIPVPLSTDAYPIAIFASFLLHNFIPQLREIVSLSPIIKALFTVLFETQRAAVVFKLTTGAMSAIAPSLFEFSVFGPIFCGTIAGCGGAFLPFDKGLKPLEKGLAPNMMTACIAATFLTLFLNTSMSEGVVDATKKAQFVVASFFVGYGLVKDVGLSKIFTHPILQLEASKAKKE